jgi:hypothetical protein
MKYKGNVPELTVDEIKGIEAAAEDAGAYIDALGKTDMAGWSYEEWMEFVHCICVCYAETIKERLASDEIPF